MNSSRKNNIVLFTSCIFLFLGIIFCQEQSRLQVVRFVADATGISLDEHFRSIGISYIATFLILSGCIGLMYFSYQKNGIRESHFYTLSTFFLLIHYFYHLSVNTMNFPVYDDQGAILDFLLKYGDSTDASGKVSLLMAPYNESMVVFPKLFALCWLKIFGQVNFSYLLLFNGFLLVIFHLLLLRKAVDSVALPLFFTLSIFVFQFQYYDDAFWVLSGLCFYGVFLLSTIAFLMLQKNTLASGYLALGCAFVTTFTFGNGWILFPLCIAFLLMKKRFFELIPWMIVFAFSLVVYFLLRSRFHPLSEVNPDITDTILFILIFLGSAFQFGYTAHIPLLAGLFIVSVFVFSIIKKRYKTAPVLFLVFTFLICSAVTASPLRSGIEPNGMYALQVRYGIFSIYAFVISIVLLYENKSMKNKTLTCLFSLAFAYNALTGIFFYPEAVLRKEKIQSVVTDIKRGKFDVKYTTLSKDDVDLLLKEAIKKGIYRP